MADALITDWNIGWTMELQPRPKLFGLIPLPERAVYVVRAQFGIFSLTSECATRREAEELVAIISQAHACALADARQAPSWDRP
ncbi:hypothetical protein [Amaricoccus solimangrovi]|uniref:Uncharacterized protein n=1 Tax=Amaricoccus solimangrovi TaxID=2589815 RepID=A0A501WXX6_9RHOB|nr:hypothetical protein [Amaricoccus solimangrovi]TPE53044.1 hypothetical protein FJM51_03190 [Amaricoccus solimangrovi]